MVLANSRIPRRIIQIWGGGSDLPQIAKAVAVNLRLLNPDFEYMLFDDISMFEFINEHFPEHQQVFHSFRFPIQRYDFFRYLVIYYLGGFYFDVDLLLSERLADLLKNSAVFPFERIATSSYLGEKYRMHWEIGNYAFGAVSRHPFVGAVIENCVRAQTNPDWVETMLKSIPCLLRRDSYIIYSTGPGLVSRTYAENQHLQDTVNILFPEDIYDKNNWNHFGRYGVHLMGSAWRGKRNILRQKLINYFFLRTEMKNIRIAKLNK